MCVCAEFNGALASVLTDSHRFVSRESLPSRWGTMVVDSQAAHLVIREAWPSTVTLPTVWRNNHVQKQRIECWKLYFCKMTSFLSIYLWKVVTSDFRLEQHAHLLRWISRAMRFIPCSAVFCDWLKVDNVEVEGRGKLLWGDEPGGGDCVEVQRHVG